MRRRVKERNSLKLSNVLHEIARGNGIDARTLLQVLAEPLAVLTRRRLTDDFKTSFKLYSQSNPI